jgi:flagellar protein FliO/FliZ
MNMKKLFLILTLCSQVAMAEGVAETSNSVTGPSTEAEATTTALETSSASKPVQAQNESEIPLNIDVAKKASSNDGVAGKIIYTIAVLLMLGGGMWFFIRKYSIPKASKTQTQIKVLTQHYFGPKKSVVLLRVAGESILVGITDQNINLIKTMSLLDEDVPEEVPQNFATTLSTRTDETQTVATAPKGATLTSDEDFAISGIRDIVQRKLQGMRNL